MKLFLSLCFLLILWTNSFSQMDPSFYGRYMDKDYTIGYTVYALDEDTENCFLVEFEQYDYEEIIYGDSGIGVCNEETGGLQFFFESTAESLDVVFGMDEYNFKTLTIKFNSGETKVLYDVTEEEYYEEFYFQREDGSEMLLYLEEEKMGFTIYGWEEGDCEYNEISGFLKPLNEDLTLFAFEDINGCKIEFLFHENTVQITEINCTNSRYFTCENWNGIYTLVEE